MRTTLAVALLACCVVADARTVNKAIEYEIDGKAYSGNLIYDDAPAGKQPGP